MNYGVDMKGRLEWASPTYVIMSKGNGLVGCERLSLGGGLGHDGCTLAEQTSALGNNDIAYGEAGLDDIAFAVLETSDRDLARGGTAIDNLVDKRLVLNLERSGLRDYDDVVESAGDDDLAGGAAEKEALRIGEHGAELCGACGLVDDAADGLDAAGVLIEAIVGEAEGDIGHILDGGIEALVLAGEGEDLRLVHGEIDVHLVIVGDVGEGGGHGGADARADAGGERSDDAVGGALHLGIGEAVLGIDELRIGLREGRIGGEEGVLGRHEVEIGDDILLAEDLFAIVGELCLREGGLSRLDIGLCRLEGGAVWHLVDYEEDLAALDLIALGDAELGESAADLGHDADVLSATDCGGVGLGGRLGGESGRDRGVLAGLLLHRLLLAGGHCESNCGERAA